MTTATTTEKPKDTGAGAGNGEARPEKQPDARILELVVALVPLKPEEVPPSKEQKDLALKLGEELDAAVKKAVEAVKQALKEKAKAQEEGAEPYDPTKPYPVPKEGTSSGTTTAKG